MELELKITCNWLCTSQKSFWKAAERGARVDLVDREHAADDSDGVLVFTVLLFTVQIYEGSTALPAHSALSSYSSCQTGNNVMDSQAFKPRRPQNSDPGHSHCQTGVESCFM